MPSISHLPNELLESIFDFVHDKTTEPTIASQKTFASLARTSKLFLPLARSHLYYRPIPPAWTYLTWKRALSLVSSLSTPLGKLVVSLEGIRNFVGKIGTLEESPDSVSFQLRGYTNELSLYYKLLSSCPRLSSVEILCGSTRHLSKLLAALRQSIPTPKTIKFANSIYSATYCITGEIVDQALERLRHANVEEIILDDVDSSTLSGNPRAPLALRSFSLQHPLDSLSCYKPLLPQNSSSLSSISVEIMLSDSDLTWILKYLPPTLRQLALNAIDLLGFDYLEDYQRLTQPSLPPSEFARFTSLTHVSLVGFCGPSLALLHTLVTSSPNIRLLDFRNSRWINPSSSSSTSTSFPIVDNSITSLLDPDALLSHLLRFKKLESVHLGWLPTRKTETFKVLKEELTEKRGVKVEWQVCR